MEKDGGFLSSPSPQSFEVGLCSVGAIERRLASAPRGYSKKLAGENRAREAKGRIPGRSFPPVNSCFLSQRLANARGKEVWGPVVSIVEFNLTRFVSFAKS